MCKLFLVVAFLAVAVFAGHPNPPSASEVQAELEAAGLSATAAEGIVAIGQKYETQLKDAKDDKEAMKKVFDEIKTDTDTYIKTQSAADQSAYTAFVEKKKAEMEAHHTSPASH